MSRIQVIGLLREAMELAEAEERDGTPMGADAEVFRRIIVNPLAVSAATAGAVQHYLNRVFVRSQVNLIAARVALTRASSAEGSPTLPPTPARD